MFGWLIGKFFLIEEVLVEVWRWTQGRFSVSEALDQVGRWSITSNTI